MDCLPALNAATQSDTRLEFEACLQLFDEALQQIFKRSEPKDLLSAVTKFNGLIQAQVGLLGDANPDVVHVFNDLVLKISSAADTWQYKADLEHVHLQGWKIACLFYEGTVHPETQKRLTCQCQVSIRHEVCSPTGRQNGSQHESFGVCVPPTAYHAKFYDEDLEEEIFDLLLIRFTFEHNFALYLAYPFLFLHEYTAHVFSTDFGNDRFNDGWMIYAAEAFLKRQWHASADSLGLDPEQVSVLHERLYQTLNPIPRRAYHFTEMFDAWLYLHLPIQFMQADA